MKKIFLFSCCMFAGGMTGIFAQPPASFDIYCSIDGKTEIAVYRNEPVLIEAKLFNSRAQGDQRWNLAVDRRIGNLMEQVIQGQLEQAEFESQKQVIEKDRRKTEIIRLGDSAKGWASALKWMARDKAKNQVPNFPLRLLNNQSANGIATLDANGLYIASLGIDPEQISAINPGTYELTISVNDISSNIIVLKILPGSIPPASAESEKLLLQFGRYYWNDNNAGKARYYAGKALEKNSRSLRAMVLLGDAYILEKSYEPALEAYHKAMAAYYRLYGQNSDPPEYLLSMINYLKK